MYDPGIDVEPMRVLMTKWYRISERLAENEARITRLKVNGSDDRWMETCKRNRTYQRRRKLWLEWRMVQYVLQADWSREMAEVDAFSERRRAAKARQADRRTLKEFVHEMLQDAKEKQDDPT
jgi:hypothetical protein